MSDVLGFFGQIGSTVINNEYANHRTQQDREANYYLNEQAAKQADLRTRALYNDFYSPEALLKQYKAAGLSPSLMFGGTPGQGGMSGAQGAGPSGPQTPVYGVDPLVGAQIANIMAQTKKTEAETDVIEPMAKATMENLLADAGLKKASTAVAEAQKTGLELDNYIKENTKEASIYTICELADKAGYEAEQAYEELKTAKVLAKVNEETLEAQIALKRGEVEALAQSITESKSRVSLNEQQKRKLYNEILQAWEQIDINWKQLNVEQQQADTYTEWINNQIPMIEKQLQVRLKELGIEKDRMVIEAVTGTIKSLAFGAMAAASFAGGKGSNATPQAAQEVLKKGYKGGNATKKGVPIYKNDYTWGF